ncbi:MAG TPA: Rieske (2Fe-2S) protein [Polyangiaceae bacterium]|nr:Rieske (2Fe-2S) protein [Polyangiaceae bacterium]
MSPAPDAKRRRTLVVLARATGCAALGLVGVPTLGFVARAGEPAATEAPFRSLSLGLDELEPDKPRRVRLDGDVPIVVWLVRQGSGVRAFAARCPHLGCSVGVAEDHRSFECPCHHARFGLNGARIDRAHNPAPRDMDPLEVRIDERTAHIEVRALHFQPGIPERVVVGSSEG